MRPVRRGYCDQCKEALPVGSGPTKRFCVGCRPPHVPKREPLIDASGVRICEQCRGPLGHRPHSLTRFCNACTAARVRESQRVASEERKQRRGFGPLSIHIRVDASRVELAVADFRTTLEKLPAEISQRLGEAFLEAMRAGAVTVAIDVGAPTPGYGKTILPMRLTLVGLDFHNAAAQLALTSFHSDSPNS
jgi:hypothetical protein